MLRHAFFALLLAGAAACGDNGTAPARAIDIQLATSEIAVTAGTSGTVNLAITRHGGYAGEVTLALDALPAGVTGAFTPSTLPDGTTRSVLTLTVVATAAASTAPITIRATGSGVADKTATVALTITRLPPSTGAIAWKFCEPVGRTVWLAVQDGTAGAWKQVIPESDTYRFDISQPKGAVAWTRDLVAGNYVTEVFYGTPDEIATLGTADCLRFPAPTRTLTGTATGFTPSTGTSGDVVTVGTTGIAATVFGGNSFQLVAVPDGPRDFIATRVSHTFADGIFHDTLTKLIIRRDVDATGSLDPFDFNSAEAVAPTVAGLTVNGTNGEPTMLVMSYLTDPTAPPVLATLLYTTNLALATKAPLYTVPFPLQRDGDLHSLSLFTGPAPDPGESNVSGRRLTRFFAAPENQTLTFGPPLTIPTSTPIADSPSRFRVQAPVQSDYRDLYVAEWIQLPSFSPTHAVALVITSAYAGGQPWDATVPDLTVAGWDPSWGLRAGVETGTFFSAQGASFLTTVLGGATNHGIVMSASRMSLPAESSNVAGWGLRPTLDGTSSCSTRSVATVVKIAPFGTL